MKLLAFSRRCVQEILRDPLNLFFGLTFPLILLLLLHAIQLHVPVELFSLTKLAPGIAVFGLSFMTLFSATLLARDRSSALLQRLYTTPMTAADFILGYTAPLLPVCLAQTAICCLVSVLLGLKLSFRMLLIFPASLPVAVFYIALGLLCGSVLNDKQVGGVCGALLTNLSAWLSGVWFDLHLVGGVFEKAAHLLPFVHAVELERAAICGGALLPHLAWVAGYALVTLIAAVLLFLRQMKKR